MRWPKCWKFQLLHHSFQRNPRADLLQNGLVGSPCSPRDSREANSYWLFRRFFHYSVNVCLTATQPPTHLTGQTYFRPKASPLPISLPFLEIFLAGLQVATVPYDSVTLSCCERLLQSPSRTNYPACFEKSKDNNKVRRMARPRWFILTDFNVFSHTMSIFFLFF